MSVCRYKIYTFSAQQLRRATSATRARERQQRNVRVNNLTDAVKASYHDMITRNYPNHDAAESVAYALSGSKAFAHQHLMLHHKTPAIAVFHRSRLIFG